VNPRLTKRKNKKAPDFSEAFLVVAEAFKYLTIISWIITMF